MSSLKKLPSKRVEGYTWGCGRSPHPHIYWSSSRERPFFRGVNHILEKSIEIFEKALEFISLRPKTCRMGKRRRASARVARTLGYRNVVLENHQIFTYLMDEKRTYKMTANRKSFLSLARNYGRIVKYTIILISVKLLQRHP